MKYGFVFISGFIHYYGVSKLSFMTYSVCVIMNYIYIYVLYRSFNNYEAKTNKLQDELIQKNE